MPISFSAVQICNLALSRIGVLTPITSVTSDTTPAGLACAALYDFCRQSLLHEYPWGWASKYTVLTLAATAPNPEWGYAYAYPVDCLYLRRLMPTPTAGVLPAGAQLSLPWLRADTDAYPSPFEVGYLNGAQVIYTNLQNASAKYTFDQGDTGPMMPEFVEVFAWRLAVDLSMSLANSEGIRQRAAKEFEKAVLAGAAHAMNEQQNSKPFTPGNTATIRGRWHQ